MSKGHGHIQRRCLEIVTASESMLDSITIAGEVFGVKAVTPSQHSTTRRALNRLRDEGHIVSLGRRQWRQGRRCWTTRDRADAYNARTRQAFGRDAESVIETSETIRRPRG